MSGNNLNAIAGAVLASVLVAMGLGTGADALFHPTYPEKAGFTPDISAIIGPDGGGGPAAPVGPPDFGRVFADPAQLAALVTRGENQVGQCRSCHTFGDGEANRIGPNLHDVFGRAAASHGGFDYSPAMREHTVTWSYLTLNEFLLSPSSAVRGTKMTFAGVRRPEDRMALIAYLRSISPHNEALPAPLPEATPAPAEGTAPPGEANPASTPAASQATPAAPH